MDAMDLLDRLQARAAAGDAEATTFLPMFAAWMVERLVTKRKAATAQRSTAMEIRTVIRTTK
ncbi:hypothetical protein QF205_03935 [Luteimonas composti]|uniref:Uncharacterized protein n=1 Tax=Luteimonas composti TaxID=398257 RepID=A0ABT6MQ48_9GAMM|nr:hypothetical protein [Luteimonas composti]MDH7452233.1 hypothetical protein [Luteimonas composti]